VAYELNVQRDNVRPCLTCKAEVATETLERIEQVLGIPFWRSVRRQTICQACGAWKREPVDDGTRARHPRTPGIYGRIVMTYVLIVGMFVIAAVQASLYWHHRERGYAAAPQASDRWTVVAELWPDSTVTVAGYAVIRVEAVTDRDVTLAACEQTYFGESDARSECNSFPVELQPIARDEVVRLFDTDVISDVERDGDKLLRSGMIAGVLAVISALLFLHARRTRHMLRPR
jgi:hypothetical protein